MTDKTSASRALVEHDQLLEKVFASLAEVVLVQDPETRVIVRCSAAAAQVLGYLAEELVGKTTECLYPTREMYEEIGQMIRSALDREGALHTEGRLKRKDGREIFADLSITEIRDERGERIANVGSIHDITRHKEAELALAESEEKFRAIVEQNTELDFQRRMIELHTQTQQQLDRLTALRAIDQIILSGLDLGDTLEVLLEEITSLLQVDAADIMLYDTSTRLLRFSAAHGLPHAPSMAMVLRLEDSFVGKAILTREMDFIPDIHLFCDDLPEFILDLLRPFSSYLAVPLAAKGEIKGVLHLYNRLRLKPSPGWMDFTQMLPGQAAIAVDNIQLFEKQQQTNRRLVEAYDNTIEGWSRALDLRDKETEGHSQRVTELTLRLAQRLGISREKLAHIRRGAQLHDIGKMGIPDEILRKEGPLTEAEWEIMCQNPLYALDFLYPIGFLQQALEIPSYHHEKWDGSGYPQGLAGEDIPLSARIFAVVDVWDALTTDRPYREARSRDEALGYIRNEAGKHFDPQVVQEFLKICNG